MTFGTWYSVLRINGNHGIEVCCRCMITCVLMCTRLIQSRTRHVAPTCSHADGERFFHVCALDLQGLLQRLASFGLLCCPPKCFNPQHSCVFIFFNFTKQRGSSGFPGRQPSWPSCFRRCRGWTVRGCCLYIVVRVRSRTSKLIGNCVGQRRVFWRSVYRKHIHKIERQRNYLHVSHLANGNKCICVRALGGEAA